MMNCITRLIMSGMIASLTILPTLAQQSDTLIVLSEVNVTENKLTNFNAGSTVYQPGQLLLIQKSTLGLDEVLQYMSPMNIDAYGVGSSSISARGAGSNRTPILWNGFNLQSIANGGTDISTLPLIFADNIRMEMGGNSALFGSGAVGGVIYLDNRPSYDQAKHSFLNTNAGSFGQFKGASGIQFGHKNYSGILRTYYQQADNDFPFKADYLSGEENITIDRDLPNANMHQFGVMSNNHFRLTNGQSISLHFWYQDVTKQIAPTVKDMAKGKSSDAQQHDQSARGAAEWKIPLNKGMISIRSGLFSSETNYQKPSSGDTTNTTGLSSINEAEVDLQLTQWIKWNLGLNYTYEEAKSSSYENQNDRNRIAAFTSFGVNNKNSGTFLSFNGRGEKAGESDFTLTGNMGITQQIIKYLSAKAKLGTSYRIPTFNDLYWYSAYAVGNPDLQAETGFNYEAGLCFNPTLNQIKLIVEGTYYKNSLENWIGWGEREDGIWTVFNQDKAEIEGLELHAGISIPFSHGNIGCDINYTYQDARDPDSDNWLPYVPKSKTAASVFGEYKGLHLIYAHSLVGKRYTSSSNSTSMPNYNIGNLSIEKRFDGKVETALTLKVNNIWNETYQTRQHYPMPGRQFLLGIQLSLN